MKFDRLRHQELDKSKPHIIAQLQHVRSLATEAARQNIWYEFPLSLPQKGYTRMYAGVAPIVLNSFFANSPTRQEIEAAKKAIAQPDFLTNPNLKQIAAKRLYQPEQWLTTNASNAQTRYSHEGFVLAVDLPISILEQYIVLSSGMPDEVAYKVPREIVRAATIQIYRFGPESYKYFQ